MRYIQQAPLAKQESLATAVALGTTAPEPPPAARIAGAAGVLKRLLELDRTSVHRPTHVLNEESAVLHVVRCWGWGVPERDWVCACGWRFVGARRTLYLEAPLSKQLCLS